MIIIKGSMLLKQLIVAVVFSASAFAAAPEEIKAAVDAEIKPILRKHEIPGMAVGLLLNGQAYFVNYGVDSKATSHPVSSDTIFEIGSVSKTFTATLSAYAETSGVLSLYDIVSKHLPKLAGSAFDKITLLQAGTYAAGELPLQVPDKVDNTAEALDWLRRWKPASTPGKQRLYSNPSIGLMGAATAVAIGQPFDEAVTRLILQPAGLTSTFYKVPESKMPNYAQGYTRSGSPVRVNPGAFDLEAYGVKSTSADMIRYIQANVGNLDLPAPLRNAIDGTHRGHYEVGPFIQALGWEYYPYPPKPADMDKGASEQIIMKANPVNWLEPAAQASGDAWFHKTGSTNGFAAYVAFVPAKKMGIVMLANKYYPNPERIRAAYEILQRLNPDPQPGARK